MFGDEKWPPIYEVWPLDVEITSCRGGPGSMATLRVKPDLDKVRREFVLSTQFQKKIEKKLKKN